MMGVSNLSGMRVSVCVCAHVCVRERHRVAGTVEWAGGWGLWCVYSSKKNIPLEVLVLKLKRKQMIVSSPHYHPPKNKIENPVNYSINQPGECFKRDKEIQRQIIEVAVIAVLSCVYYLHVSSPSVSLALYL